MKIAYIAQNNPYDKHSWSGTDYYARLSLEKQGNTVYCIYGFHLKEPWYWRLRKFFYKILHKEISFKRTFKASKQWANFIMERLEKDTDAIFSLGTIQVACLETKIPIFIYVDGIFEQMRIEYGWSKLSYATVQEANSLEQKALNNCTCIISCAIETMKAIRNYYDIEEKKIELVPLGANWDSSPSHVEVLKSIKNRSKTKCKLLFVGVDWNRKGADIVLETSRILVEQGLDIELHICGIKKVPISLPKYVHNHGFLNKSNESDISLLKQLFFESHFLFVPSRAEAYGLVFCEASAYGLPSISHRIGGLTTTIVDGVNGQLFDLGTSPYVFANYIKKTFEDQAAYKLLCYKSLERFEKLLNWTVSGEKLSNIIYANI